jgi:hypothetical protein
MASLHDFCEWLGATDVSVGIQTVNWIIPTVQTVHILCIALVISSAAMINLRLVGALARDEPVAGIARRYLPWIWYILPVMLLTGAILVIGEPARSLENPAFQLKMVLLAAAILTMAIVQRQLRRDPLFWESSDLRRVAARGLASISVILWVGIVFAGRWIAYLQTAAG